MPIKECKIEGIDGFKWGDNGKCYIHDGTPRYIKDAKRKALIQGISSGEYTKNTLSNEKGIK